MGPVKYNLLVWFLKHKDEIANSGRLYLIGWSHLKPHSIPQNHQDSLKNEISIINAALKALGLSLKIEPDRLIGYRCEGNCSFCLIFKSKHFPSGHISSEQVPEIHTALKEDL